MTKDEIKEYLKENLKIIINIARLAYVGKYIEVQLFLDNELISRSETDYIFYEDDD